MGSTFGKNEFQNTEINKANIPQLKDGMLPGRGKCICVTFAAIVNWRGERNYCGLNSQKV